MDEAEYDMFTGLEHEAAEPELCLSEPEHDHDTDSDDGVPEDEADGDDAAEQTENVDYSSFSKKLQLPTGGLLVKLDYLRFAMKARLSEKSHQELAATFSVGQNAPDMLPKHMKTLKRAAYRYLAVHSLQVNNIAPAKTTEPIPYVDSVQCAYIWMQHPQLSQIAAQISQSDTEPYMDFIYQNRHNLHLPRGRKLLKIGILAMIDIFGNFGFVSPVAMFDLYQTAVWEVLKLIFLLLFPA